MEIKFVYNAFRLIPSRMSLALLLVCGWFSSTVVAGDFLCDASQASHNELPVLASNCPIGQGLWGKKAPQSGNDFYWIQCGLFAKAMPLDAAKSIYQQISSDVWMKRDQGSYRCLIGPYLEFAEAKQDLHKVKALPSYRDAFIREVKRSASVLTSASKAVSQSAPAITAVKTQASQLNGVTQTKPRQSATQANPKSAVASSTAEPKLSHNNVEVRLKAVLQGKTYVVPYAVENRDQFYMEHGKAWNRLSYSVSTQVCKALGMGLASVAEFQTLRSSGVMEQNNWPVQLPYWGKERMGLFIAREPSQLTGTSLLNVLCVK